MAAAFKAVHTDGITTDSLGLQSVANRCALVDNLDTRSLQLLHVLLGAAAGGFNRLDTTADDNVNVLGVRRRVEGRQEGQVYTEGFIRHLLAAGDFTGEMFRRRLGQGGNHAQTTGIGDCRCQFGKAYVVHATLYDRVLDSK